MSKISPCLWFNGEAEEAAKFYVSLLPDSRIEKIQRNTTDSRGGKAATAGGNADPAPKQDFGFMYGRSFEDPDGHIWEVMWMDVAAATAAQSATAEA